MLCHTALVWDASVDGRALNFRLIGINNLNLLMEDEETGSWWQQSTGEAIHGPLKGERLKLISAEEVNFEIWSRENPQSLVLLPDEATQKEYPKGEDWDTELEFSPDPEHLAPDDRLEAYALVVGVEIDGRAKAWPMDDLIAHNPISDRLGDVPILLAVGADGRSVRVFDRRVGGEEIELYQRPDSNPPQWLDPETGSVFSFSGAAVDGPLAGSKLEKLPYLRQFWFDWRTHRPETKLYTAGKIGG